MKKCTVSFIIGFILLHFFFLEGFAQVPVADIDEIRVNPGRLPVAFDLRESGFLSPIKTQSTGGCWSSSVMATVEPWMRISGIGDFWFSDRNLQVTHGFDNSRNTYGNHFMATAYFSRGSGPAQRGAGQDSSFLTRPQIPFILSDARYLPGVPDLVKQVVMEYGPVYTMLYFKRNLVDSLTNVMRQPDNPRNAINHAVVLVGWNDTLTTADGEGVWILQNSLGAKFGESGFFYVPYQNTDILKHNAVWNSWEPFDEHSRILYYDTLGSFESYGFNDSLCFGLTRFTADAGCRIVRLASHINNPGTYLSFEIYRYFDMDSRTLTGKVGEAEEMLCLFPGYYTCNLANPVSVYAGDDFYVLARYNAPMSTQPLAVENTIEDYSQPHLTAGRNWVNPDFEKWPDAWYECGANTEYPVLDFDLCIRVVIEIMDY